jgi:hypothetical protein
MSATAQPVAVDVQMPAIDRPVAVDVERPAARPVPAPPRRERTERWVYPFGITLAASLVFFVSQMAEYTTLLG